MKILHWVLPAIAAGSLAIGSGYVFKNKKLPSGPLYWFWAYSILWLWSYPTKRLISTDTPAQVYYIDLLWQAGAVGCGMFLFYYAGEARNYLPLKKVLPLELAKYLALALIPGAIMVLTAHDTGRSHEIISALAEGGASAAVFFLGMCVVAPFCEEILFRGVLLRERTGMDWRLTLQGLPVFFSTIIFAWLHSNFWSATILGLIGVALRRRFDSLLASIAFHMVWNGGLATGVLLRVHNIL